MPVLKTNFLVGSIYKLKVLFLKVRSKSVKSLDIYVSHTRRVEFQSIGLFGSFNKIAKTEGLIGSTGEFLCHYHTSFEHWVWKLLS